MAVGHKFKDKFYILNCDMPSELFTVKGIKREYRELAKIWHPDVSDEKEALYIMSKVNALYHEGRTLIEQNKFYEKERLLRKDRGSTQKSRKDDDSEPTVDYTEHKEPMRRSTKKKSIEIKKTTGQVVRFKYLKRVLIDMGYMYLSESYFMLEITKLKRKIFMDALAVIQAQDATFFRIEMPNVVDSFDSKTHGYLVFKKEKGIEPIVVLESVMGYLKALGNRKICEGMFYDLTALKHMGLTSTGIDKELLFINVNTGKLYNYGLYFYLHEFSSKLNRAPKEVTESLNHLKPKDNESLIIDLIKDQILKLNLSGGLKVDDFHKWLEGLRSDSLERSLAESQVFNRAIASVTTHGFTLDNYYQGISYN